MTQPNVQRHFLYSICMSRRIFLGSWGSGAMEYGVWSMDDPLFHKRQSFLWEIFLFEGILYQWSHCSNNNLWTVYVEVADFSHLSYLNIPVGMPGLQWLTLWPCCSLHTGGYPGWDEGSEHEHPAPAGGHLPRGRGRPFTVAPTTTWSYPLHSPLPRVRKLVFLLVQMIVLPCSFWSAADWVTHTHLLGRVRRCRWPGGGEYK